MTTFDVWMGRIAAMAGVVYVALSDAWPLAGGEAEPIGPAEARSDARRAR